MPDGLSILEAVVLGIVQGITEWLPVSSSGHLALAHGLFGLQAPLFFDLVLHVGTLAVIVLFYRGSVAAILRAVIATPRARREAGSWPAVFDDPDRRMAVLVVAGSVPTAVVGFALEAFAVGAFSRLSVVAWALVVTGTWLMLTRWAPRAGGSLTWTAVLLIGAVQGAAVIPGISRSGATIGMALLLGVERDLAVRFSFLLSVPAILGATILQADAASLADAGAHLPAYLAGALVAAVVGYAALALLVRLVRQQVFHRFAWYCWAVGGTVLTQLLLT